MKITFIIIFALVSSLVTGQVVGSFGADNITSLNRSEVDFFKSIMIERDEDSVDIINKQIAFITGGSGATILNKRTFFERQIFPWTKKGLKPPFSFIILTKEEKYKSGGYDLLMLSLVKMFTKSQRRKIINRLAVNQTH